MFGGGLDAYENGFPEALDLVLAWLREPRVAGRGERFGFREVAVVPRADELLVGRADAGESGAGPETVVACTSPKSVRLAAARALPMLLGMHCGDEEKAEMVALWRTAAREAGHPPEVVEGAAHVSAGVAQIADGAGDATELLVKTMPGWLRQGLDAHVTVDGRHRVMQGPGRVHGTAVRAAPGGHAAGGRGPARGHRRADRDHAVRPAGGGSGDLAATEENVRRLGADVLPLLT